jgi:DNA mismatch endonuclease, patch repair protein
VSEILHSDGSSSAEFAAEQDRAAGGRDARKVRLNDGNEALASVRMQMLKGKKSVYAYLRYRAHGETKRHYIGKVVAPTRAEALTIAWRIVREKNLLDQTTR